MNKLLKLAVYTSWLWLFLILLSVLSAVDPVSAGPGGILLVFVLIYLVVASLLFTILHGGVRFVTTRMMRRGDSVSGKSYRVSVRKAYYMASAVAFGPVLLLALNSVRQLQVTDVLLTLLFLSIVIFYISKRD